MCVPQTDALYEVAEDPALTNGQLQYMMLESAHGYRELPFDLQRGSTVVLLLYLDEQEKTAMCGAEA